MIYLHISDGSADLEGLFLPVCSRIHVMAGRVPAGSQRTSVAREMEETFIQNLRYAADLLSKVLSGRNLQEEPPGGTFRRNLRGEPSGGTSGRNLQEEPCTLITPHTRFNCY